MYMLASKKYVLSLFCFSILSLANSQVKQIFWSTVSEKDLLTTGVRQIIPQKYLCASLNGNAFKDKLWAAPSEKQVTIDQSTCVIYLPMPNGTMQAFKVAETNMMEKGLADHYPNIKTFSIKGIDDPYANGKLDWNDFGFHGMIRSINGDVFIDPYCLGNSTNYISYYTSDFVKDPQYIIPETVITSNSKNTLNTLGITAAPCAGTVLHSYRLAVACTGEYAIAATGSATPTKSQTLSKVVTTVNRINSVYETEVDIRMILVANDTLVLFTNPNTDPFTGNNSAVTLLAENTTVLNANIGAANYDIGHAFGTGVGGLATLSCVCTNAKAEGVTGSNNPVGDPFDIDYVAHEMGHQFGAGHTFNSVLTACNGNRTAATAVEPGSGITIMAYAGICGTDNMANNSIPYFHAISYDQITGFTISDGTVCVVNSSSGNNPPVVTGSPTYTIPFSTPFTLTGSATDPDSDALTYSWEETDPGLTSGTWNSGNVPYFRSYAPTTIPSRTFPKLAVILSGSMTSTPGEYLPSNAQTLNFRLTARDNKMGGGGVCTATSQVIVCNNGPFAVTYPNVAAITWSTGAAQTVSWSANNTNLAPVSCASVNILISLDNGATFNMLVANTPNDGSENVTVPSLVYTNGSCRIKVEAIGNIFFDISDNAFTILVGDYINEYNANPFGLTLSPNPTNSLLNLKAKNPDTGSFSTLLITDVVGKTIIEDKINDLEINKNYNLENMGAGLYFVILKNKNCQSLTKVIKQ